MLQPFDEDLNKVLDFLCLRFSYQIASGFISRYLQAFVGDRPTFENFAAKSKDCSFKVVGKSFFQSGFGIALKRNSSFTAVISKALIQYKDYDIARKLRSRWFDGQCKMEKTAGGATFRRVSLRGFSGLFLATCVSIMITGMLSILESCSDKIQKARKYLFS